MNTKVIIESFIPATNIELCKAINKAHKDVLDKVGWNIPSNNTEWFDREDALCFYAYDSSTNEIFCAYRIEFIKNEIDVLNSTVLKGVDINKYSLLYERLIELSREGLMAETAAFWCDKEMKYKNSLLSRLVFTFGMKSAIQNNAANIMGITIPKLTDYYSVFGLVIDNQYKKSFIVSETKLHCYLLVYNENVKSDFLFNEIESSINVIKELIPYEGVYYQIKEPVVIKWRK